MASAISNNFFSKKMMRLLVGTQKIFGVVMFCCLCNSVFSAVDSIPIKKNILEQITAIKKEQRRIDMLDGIADRKVTLRDPTATTYAGKVYFDLSDSLLRAINNPEFNESRKLALYETLLAQMQKIDSSTVYGVKRYDVFFRFMSGEMNAILQNNLYPYLVNNINQAFNTFAIVKNESCADSFLVFASNYRPDLVFINYRNYGKKSYSLHVIEEASKIAPVTVKRYFNPGDPIYEALKLSHDSVVKIILQIKERYMRKSNAFTLLDGIVSGAYTMEKADAIGKEPRKFLQAMLKIRGKKNPLAAHSLEGDLAIYSLKFVRVLNDLHNEKDEVRFASIEKFTGEELYTLMVYSEEEIFTSTFNGLFKRMMVKMGPVSGFEFLGQLGDNRFRTFIKMCAGFGKLPRICPRHGNFGRRPLPGANYARK